MSESTPYSSRITLVAILRAMALDKQDQADITYLRYLVDWVRQAKVSDEQSIDERFKMLIDVLAQEPDLRIHLKEYIEQFLQESRYRFTFAELGILTKQTFSEGMRSRIFERLLPATIENKTLQESLNILFPGVSDHQWFSEIQVESWQKFFDIMGWLDADGQQWSKVKHEMLEAMEILAVRVAALGIEGEVVRCLGITTRHTSPFVEQHMELRNVIEQAHQRLNDNLSISDLGDHLDVLLDQCAGQIKRAHAQAKVRGISILLSAQLIRLEQSINRLRTLLQLIGAMPASNRSQLVVTFMRTLVREENRKHSVADLWRGMTEKVALRVTEHASHTGEHYTAENRKQYWQMAKAAMGGGAIIAFFAFLKTHMLAFDIAPFWEAMLLSLNYGLCFVVVHVLHCQVATKQPAMTAARIASALESSNGRLKALDQVVELVTKVIRTQFVAISGNLLVAFIAGAFLSYLWSISFGEAALSPAKVDLFLYQLNPVTSGAIPHAAMAGVALFLTGVVSGYYDNLCIYENIPTRIKQVGWLTRLLGENRLGRFAKYLEHNLGAIMGCLFLGLMLGSLGFVGILFGLPIDTTHFAFSSANLGMVTQIEGAQLGLLAFLWGLLGVVLIGLGNLTVSFGLALYTALKARRIQVFQGGVMFKKLGQKLLHSPLSFFLPPKEEKPSEDALPAEKKKPEDTP